MMRIFGLWAVLSAVTLTIAAASPALAAEHTTEKTEEAPKEKKPKAPKKSVCENQALSYQQRYLCGQQMAKVQTKPELKKVEQHYTDIVREVERKQKEGHE